MKIYNEELLKNDLIANCGRPYQQCTISVMDTIADPDIRFDKNGICNYYTVYQHLRDSLVFEGDEGKIMLTKQIDLIKYESKGKKYDCILGLSGGIDSTYLALLAKENGLNPLLVHFDYGWNLELAVQNIENIVKTLGFDLYTIVMDWEEMKSLQRAYYKSSVLDLDVPADHMIFGALYKTAVKFRIKYILSGKNIVTEAILPKTWNYEKFDLVNLKNINKQFENGTLKKLPKLGLWQFGYYKAVRQIKLVDLLNLVPYNKEEVKKRIATELGWKDYGGKHYENIFTRFYQGYILPVKFGIDKRKAHLSTLIFSQQLAKEDAITILKNPPCDMEVVKNDFEYVSKKLGFSQTEFLALIEQPNRTHEEFGTDKLQQSVYYTLFKIVSPVTKSVKYIKKLFK